MKATYGRRLRASLLVAALVGQVGCRGEVADGRADPCAVQCQAHRCGSVGACGAVCGRAGPPVIEVSAPTDALVSMEATLHTKQEKIAVTADGTIHVYLQLAPQGAAYARSRDGGRTWEAFQRFDDRGWLGVLTSDDRDDLYLIYASSWSEGGVYHSAPMAVEATVDKTVTPWTWRWGTPVALIPNPPNPRHGFLDFARDPMGTFHLVTASGDAFSFDAEPARPVHTAINYFRSTGSNSILAFEPVDQLVDVELWPVRVPDFALGFAGSPAIEVDGEGNVVIVYSDRSLYQSGVERAIWSDTWARGTLFVQRYLREAGGWRATAAQELARGVYGDADILVDADGTVHVVYTVVQSGSSYRVAYRRVASDDTLGDETLLSNADTSAVERTIFPSLARLDDGGLAVAFTDRTTDASGNLAMVVRPRDAGAFSCVLPLTEGSTGRFDVSLHTRVESGALLFVYLTEPGGGASDYPLRFGRAQASAVLAAVSQ